MADRFPGEITLGGTIVINTIEERERVENALSLFGEYCSHSYGEPRHGHVSIEEVPELLNDSGMLVGKDDQARYGEFEEVEAACREAGIGYSRHSSARYEYDAEQVEWRPGMEEAHLCFANDGGNLYLQEETARRILTLLDDGEKPPTERIEAAKELIKSELGDHIPALEPFKIIDNAPPSED
tara:strand:- start:19348 stop:19896 length:549 start_codon:yes stop_codon:yes gene_type:complete